MTLDARMSRREMVAIVGAGAGTIAKIGRAHV